jgi:hypothetical protein
MTVSDQKLWKVAVRSASGRGGRCSLASTDTTTPQDDAEAAREEWSVRRTPLYDLENNHR